MASPEASDGPIPFGNAIHNEKDDPFLAVAKSGVPAPATKEPIQNIAGEEIAGDASALFGAGGGDHDVDALFGNMSSNAASFFEQHSSALDQQNATQTNTFFDQVVPTVQSQEKEQEEIAQFTNAAVPTTVSDPTATQYGHEAENYYAQYQTSDPNVHYYYDEQGQIHYYDPNTNQEYDYSYEQYAQYYAQQGYGQQPQADQYYSYGQEQVAYDPNQAHDAQQQQQQQHASDSQYTTHQPDQATELAGVTGHITDMSHSLQGEAIDHSMEHVATQPTVYAEAVVPAVEFQHQEQPAEIGAQQEESVFETKYDPQYYTQQPQEDQYYAYGQEQVAHSPNRAYDPQQQYQYEINTQYTAHQPLAHETSPTANTSTTTDQHLEQPYTPEQQADQYKPLTQDPKHQPQTNDFISTTEVAAEVGYDLELSHDVQSKTTDHVINHQGDQFAEYNPQEYDVATSDLTQSQQHTYDQSAQQPATIPVADQEEANPITEYDLQLHTYDPFSQQPATIPVSDDDAQQEESIPVTGYHPESHDYDPFTQHAATIPKEELDTQNANDIPVAEYGWEENVYDQPVQEPALSNVQHDTNSYDPYYMNDQGMESIYTGDHNEQEPSYTPQVDYYAQSQQFVDHGLDRRLSAPNDHQYGAHAPLERSSTVPPPAITRLTSPPVDALLPCPDPSCEGENKGKAKFCCECGRPLAGISRSTTPAARYSDSMVPSVIPYHLPTMESSIYAATPPDTYAPTIEYDQRNMAEMTAPPEGMNGYIDEIKAPQREYPPDPLGRSRGCPLVTFGFGGKICLMYPQTVQRFTAGSGAPIKKTMPSAIHIKSLQGVLGNQHNIVSSLSEFVGPVLMDSKAGIKSKKKDVLVYMEKRIAELKLLVDENSLEYSCAQTKTLLWELVYTLVQQDGTIGDGDKMDNAIRALLEPPAVVEEEGNFSVPAYTQESTDDNPEPDRSDIVLATVQKYLLSGDREAAVQYAIQEDMWAHALIISSCVNKDLWKTVINGFIERELCATAEDKRNRVYHSTAGDKQSLRVLYSLFSGSGAAAMSEFLKTSNQHPNVPYGNLPSAPPADETQLSQWRETLTLILANRTSRDTEAITALGDILKSNGWIEAAHLCELFEFSCSIKQSSATPLPFLQGYKLAHAWWLADIGLLPEAQRYCESIADAIKAYTKPSPYLHRQLLEKLKEFAELCEIASGHGTDAGSWIKTKLSKGSLDSLWGSLEGKFNKFVSGDDTLSEEPQSRQSMEIIARSVSSAVESAEENRRRAGTPMTNDTYGVRSASPYTPAYAATTSYDHGADSMAVDGQQNVYGHGYGYGYNHSQAAPRGTHSPFQHGAAAAQSGFSNSNSNVNGGGWWSGVERDSQAPPQQAAFVPQPTSYQPDSYEPSAVADTTSVSWNTDDDLGFGNAALNKSKPSNTESTEDTTQTTAQAPATPTTEEAKTEAQASKGWGIFSLFSRGSTPVNKDEKKAVKANLGEQNAFYYDEKEKCWVNRNAEAAPAPTPPPPPPKATAAPMPAAMTLAPSAAAAVSPPPPPPPSSSQVGPERVSSAPNPVSSLPNAPPPAFNTPPPPPSGGRRAGAGGRKPMRSRYVDVFNQPSN
ncbi:vesicle coat component [Apophysomyces sp. BC1034]|nr:vesicle coat component [Apophysomyces sp. BC1021]KAG0187439.1 vesicle coat component [Apophysomyces sp. BC1034]